MAGEPATGELPVVGGVPEVAPGGGRRIRATAPVSTAADTGTFPRVPELIVPPAEAPPAEAPPPATQSSHTQYADSQTHDSQGFETSTGAIAPPVSQPVFGQMADVPSTPVTPSGPQAPPTSQPIPGVPPAPVTPAGPQAPPAHVSTPAHMPAAPGPVPLPQPVAVDPTSAGVLATKKLQAAKKAAAAAVRRTERRAAARSRLSFWTVVLAVGVIALAAAALHVGPEWLGGAGAVLVLTTYSWAAAARTGGRQVVFAVVAFVIGVSALVVDGSVLRSGAAVLTCVVSGVLAVVLTVPARNFVLAVREVVLATAIASIGAYATVGFEPVASAVRFNYLTLALGFGALLLLVWRFAAGLHGLGTRGLVILGAGTLLLTVSLAYTEALRHFGVTAMTQPLEYFTDWSRDTIGAAPRMLTVLLGVPALVWGVHMRARRRQGWWVCTFGAAATLPVAQRLVNLDTSYVEAGLQTAYSVALGILVGWVLIRVDQQMSGTRGARARAAEEHEAVRPEPRRFSSL